MTSTAYRIDSEPWIIVLRMTLSMSAIVLVGAMTSPAAFAATNLSWLAK